MPYIQKQKITKKSSRKEFVFENFRLYRGEKTALVAGESLNCDCKNGKLTCGLGVTPYKLDGTQAPSYSFQSEVRAVHLVKVKPAYHLLLPEETLYVTTTDGWLYFYNKDNDSFTSIMTGSFLSIRSKYDWASGTTLYYIGKRTMMTLPTSDERISVSVRDRGVGQMFKDRLFYARNEQDIRYSALDGGFTQSIEGSGVLYGRETDGRIQGIIVWQDELYVFYEYEIRKLRVTGSPTEFEMEKVASVDKRIYFNTPCLCKDAIFFLTEGGVYRFDGKRAGQVCDYLSIEPLEDDERCTGASVRGAYAVAFKDKAGESKMAIIASDGESGYFSTPVQGLTENGDLALFRNDGYIGTFDENSACADICYFNSKKLDFGKEGRKTLKQLRFYGEGLMEVCLKGNGWERWQTVDLQNGEAVWDIWEKSENFWLNMRLDYGTTVHKIVADVVFPNG